MANPTLAELKSACEQAARAGGAQLNEWVGKFGVREKGPRDLVTEADLASQKVIRDLLLGKFPEHGFLGEEGINLPSQRDGYRWVVDPLDGTTNFVHQVPNYAVSVALECDGTLLVGCVYDPSSDECYVAAQGQGATLNDRPLASSTTRDLSQALVANSFAAKVTRTEAEVAEFLEVLEQARATRRMGSSALNLCYVAAGRFDAYWSTTTQSWDIAAGVLLVQEAGGMITHRDGGPVDLSRPQVLAAATPELHRQLADCLTRACR